MKAAGAAELGVQGVQLHTQYIAKIEKLVESYQETFLYVTLSHPIFHRFNRPWGSIETMQLLV